MAGSGYRDYFKVLGVDRGADADAIKRAFRKLARQYHPDVNPGDTPAEAKFKEVSEAYEVLSDPDKRRRYEQFGQYWNQAGAGAGAGPGGFDVDFGRYGNFDDFINDLLGRFGGPGGGGIRRSARRLCRRRFPGRGFVVSPGGGFPRGASRPPVNLDAETSVKVSFSEAFRGAERTPVGEWRAGAGAHSGWRQDGIPSAFEGQRQPAARHRPSRRPVSQS